jgi:nucleoside-diphosphate-sugar epimerase
VSHAIAKLHLKEKLAHDIYHLSSGNSSETCRDVAQAMAETLGRKARFAPWMIPGIKASADALASSKAKNAATLVGSLVSVFLPYILWNTVFDNTRVTTEIGSSPTPFTRYCGPLYTWSKQQRFKYTPTPFEASV